MAIAQSRLIALIAAAEDYQQALLSLREQAFALQRNWTEGAVTVDDALKGLLFELQDITRRLKFPIETTATIADEKSHFRSNAARNEKAAKRAEKKRRKRGARIMPATRQGLVIVPTARTKPSQLKNTGLIDTKAIEAEADEALVEMESRETEGGGLVEAEEGQTPD